MSKPMIRSKPASRDTSTAPTMPPAGPDRIASLPWKRCASVSPPELCMNCSRTGVAASPLARSRSTSPT